MKRLLFLIFSITATIASPLGAQFDPFAGEAENKKTEASLIAEQSAIAPGQPFTLAIRLKHQAGWHSYYQNPGGPGLPLKFTWKLPEGYQLQKFHWPTPHLYNSGGFQFYVYEGEYYLLADILAPAGAQAGDKANIAVNTEWQLCDANGCDPSVEQELTITLPVAAAAQIAQDQVDLFKTARSHLPTENTLWDVTAAVGDEEIALTFVAKDGSDRKLGNVHYVDNQGVFNPEKKQWALKKGGNYVLTLPRNSGVNVGEELTGIVVDTDNHTAFLVTIPASGAVSDEPTEVAEKSDSGHGPVNEAPTEEDLKEAAALYNPDAKIDYVLLDGTKEKSHNLLTALGFIFIGGFLLNLMPCVFPVLGIKVMGFAQQAGQDPRKIKMHGLVFMSGLVVSMWILAGIIYTLIFAFGRDVNWGEQLTSPVFLSAMIILLFLFGLNMAGVFEVGTSLTGAGSELQSKKGYSGSFFSGVLTTLIATPCSGPFLGSVMGYTLKQPPLQGMIIFTVFALGISLPYVVLAFFPALINKLPRPGAWMETFKQMMSFALFATAAYFFRSFAKITGVGGASWLLMALVVLGLAVWAYGRFGTPYTPKTKKFIWGYGFPLLVTIGGFSLTKTAVSEKAPPPPLTGSSWYPGVVELNRTKKKRIVWVDHTADW